MASAAQCPNLVPAFKSSPTYLSPLESDDNDLASPLFNLSSICNSFPSSFSLFPVYCGRPPPCTTPLTTLSPPIPMPLVYRASSLPPPIPFSTLRFFSMFFLSFVLRYSPFLVHTSARGVLALSFFLSPLPPPICQTGPLLLLSFPLSFGFSATPFFPRKPVPYTHPFGSLESSSSFFPPSDFFSWARSFS